MSYFTTDIRTFGPTDDPTDPAPGFEVTSIEGLHFAARGFEPTDGRAPHGAAYVHEAKRIEVASHQADSITLRVIGEVGLTVSIFGVSLQDLADAVQAEVAWQAKQAAVTA
jgi:hypothetical protein